METKEALAKFCGVFLRTMDPERAAETCGLQDGWALLRRRSVERRLEKMRQGTAGQMRKEDAVRRLAQLAFGRANDAVALALRPREMDPETLDLSAVTEFRVTDKGGVEIKLADRVKALETLCHLLEERDSGGIEELYQALESAAGQMEGAAEDG